MERGVHDTRLDAIGDDRSQHGIARAAADPAPVAFGDAALFGIEGMDLQHVLAVET